MAWLAEASYENTELSDDASAEGWEIVDKYKSKKTGFHAVLFENKVTGEHVLGFAGTDPSFHDYYTDVVQGLGVWTGQYKQAIDLAAKLKQQYPNLRLTGHSLGGGLASAASIINRIAGTVTFNAAGVHPWTVSRYNSMPLGDAPGLITAFRVKGEFLSSSQDGWWLFGLPIVEPDGVGTTFWLDGTMWDPFTKHGMDNIHKGLKSIYMHKELKL
ncbi:MAG: hypothetical protein JWP89_3695 [Schlesneria sp.]|nr:hypothetical protein [Schlesneria sp.]